MTTITEADDEADALDWLAADDSRPDIAPDTPGAEPDDYRQVVLERRLRGCLGPAKSGPARTGAA